MKFIQSPRNKFRTVGHRISRSSSDSCYGCRPTFGGNRSFFLRVPNPSPGPQTYGGILEVFPGSDGLVRFRFSGGLTIGFGSGSVNNVTVGLAAECREVCLSR
ncbi:hypothetical protein TNIN_385171 [Trichonephila inaurata madagascariensis]|uniref:Uncharacterized protein n=1 Tax=Trichonephila inaurata madagascariensis TaxID=2747483 RepID=A0A8X7BUI1_9ARAC|nr:hypothetical protein TNIN_385171 [Trichonephila inaurata madagascariensis]